MPSVNPVNRTPNELKEEALKKELIYLLENKKYKALQKLCEKSLQENPDCHAFLYLKGLSLSGQHHYKNAISDYKQFLAFQEDHVDAWINLAIAYENTGQTELALESLKNAYQLDANNPSVISRLGALHGKASSPEQAIAWYEQVLITHPDNIDLLLKAGSAQFSNGNYKVAKGYYEKVLNLDPGNVVALGNLGAVYYKSGHFLEAITLSHKTLEAGHKLDWLWINYAETLSALPAQYSVPKEFIPNLITCLTSKTIDSNLVTRASIGIIKAALANGLHNPSGYSIENIPSDVLQLLQTHMKEALIIDIEVENFLVIKRKELLNTIVSGNHLTDMERSFLQALSIHCLLNEFVWFQSEIEREEINKKRTDLISDLEKGERPNTDLIYCLGMYLPLYEYQRIEKWALSEFDTADDEQAEFISRIFLERIEQEKLINDIPAIKDVKDQTSQIVRSQYEENPYPRWRSFSSSGYLSISNRVTMEILPNRISIRNPMAHSDVLIAGCGTGKHALQSATGYKDANITAIDLSMRSLAYARFKANEHGIRNINFVQGDILDLPDLKKSFDIIECSGVLHHMQDPEKGLRALLGILKPQGLIKLGLYSEHARNHIARIREIIQKNTNAVEVKDIRKIRNDLKTLSPELYLKCTTSKDFYASSSFRDLVLHVQEIRYTIPRLEMMLRDNGLEFLGFVLKSNKTKINYQKQYSDDKTCTNLKYWDEFEKENPKTFASMYQFWCRKAG